MEYLVSNFIIGYHWESTKIKYEVIGLNWSSTIIEISSVDNGIYPIHRQKMFFRILLAKNGNVEGFKYQDKFLATPLLKINTPQSWIGFMKCWNSANNYRCRQASLFAVSTIRGLKNRGEPQKNEFST